ncbi:MAG: hypothetical protein H0V16_12360 [Burkholderiaceae bacterium]|nr:hypothetical protein [Burkholderiaceae bacterium]
MKTIAGIDADGDGVRDDVQRYIAENWGHSERAIRALTNIAKARQAAVIAGDSVSREEAQALAQPMLNAGSCYILAGDQALKDTQALQKVAYKVMNTPERFKRGRDFEYKAGHTVYPLNQASTPQICGFDPAALPN